jgi:hypothetical protein
MPKTTKIQPAAKRLKIEATASKSERPDWLDNTPVMDYMLRAIADQEVQTIELTVDEYDALKEHLAKMRGYKALKAA